MTGALATPCDAAVAAARPPARNPACRWTLAACILGSSLAFIDGSVVNVALPALQRDLGADAAALAWTINAYLLPLGALILLGGGAGDHFGRRRLFLLGLGLFGLASAACAAAPSIAWLLAGRAMQGVGAALLMPNSLAILGATFQGEARGRAIGTWAAVGALAGAIGPLAGGWLVETVGWRAIFLINLPIAAAAAWLAHAHVRESHGRAAARLDWAGAALATLALALLTWALTEAAGRGAGGLVLPATLMGAALLAGFLWLERRRGPRALLPMAMFASRPFLGLTLLTFLLYGALGGLIVLLPYLLIRIEGWSALAAGAALLPLPLLIGLGSPLMGRLTARHGGRLPLAAGAAVTAAGLALYARLDGEGIAVWTGLMPATALVGIGMALSAAPLTTTVMASVDAGHTGAASGFNSAVARLGGLVATALLGAVLALPGPAEFIAGFRLAALLGAACAGLAAIAALLLIPPPAPVAAPATAAGSG
ncbi:MFS transporter [Paracraurococcus lichenis]|uniref:MFS transporter n=1 Tax=Paracraurococcus lichenis TaxID=3064888 RepID=A0ABT9E439_9PROT|nr:MFS transporter [Paracraurococcus sp. LOR1-02]MDO9710917.1 MFS transporter [Paracraurococcus sp. LOR1-02]